MQIFNVHSCVTSPLSATLPRWKFSPQAETDGSWLEPRWGCLHSDHSRVSAVLRLCKLAPSWPGLWLNLSNRSLINFRLLLKSSLMRSVLWSLVCRNISGCMLADSVVEALSFEMLSQRWALFHTVRLCPQWVLWSYRFLPLTDIRLGLNQGRTGWEGGWGFIGNSISGCVIVNDTHSLCVSDAIATPNRFSMESFFPPPFFPHGLAPAVGSSGIT